MLAALSSTWLIDKCKLISLRTKNLKMHDFYNNIWSVFRQKFKIDKLFNQILLFSHIDKCNVSYLQYFVFKAVTDRSARCLFSTKGDSGTEATKGTKVFLFFHKVKLVSLWVLKFKYTCSTWDQIMVNQSVNILKHTIN